MSGFPRNVIDPAVLRLAALIESSDDAIVTQNLDGAIETWNRAAEKLFGYTAEEAIGQQIDLIIPDAEQEAEAAAQARLEVREGVNFETSARTKSGALLPVSVTMTRLVTPTGETFGVSRVTRDLSRQKALEREAFRLAAIVNSAEDAIVSKDLNGIVQTWNRAAERMFGYTAEEMVGRSIRAIIPSDRQSEEDEVLSRVRAGIAIEHFETVRQRKDGTPIDISLSVSPIRNAAGTIIGASKIARDITAQRRLARQAEEASRVKDEFLATLSHELRTPLNAVLGYTRMLRVGDFAEGRRDQIIDIIERNAKILSQLVSDVLDVSAIVTGKIRVKPGPCDLIEVLQAAVDVLRPAAAAKGVDLRLEGPESLPTQCDTDRLQQVFWNLLSNAVKFTPAGGSVIVRAATANGTAEITVSDTGIGIRPELLPFVFQRFWQAENVAGRQTGGLGLGLALARHFVELHGGHISAHSDGENRGTTFTITLPLRRESHVPYTI